MCAAIFLVLLCHVSRQQVAAHARPLAATASRVMSTVQNSHDNNHLSLLRPNLLGWQPRRRLPLFGQTNSNALFMGIFNVRGGAEEEEEDVKVAAEPVEEKEEGPTEAETATETPAKEEAATEAETDGETEASKAKEEEEESDEEEEEETEEESDEEESDAEEEEVADVTQDMSVETSEFDEPLVMSPMIQLYATFGVMMLARKVDMTSPTVVKFARYVLDTVSQLCRNLFFVLKYTTSRLGNSPFLCGTSLLL